MLYCNEVLPKADILYIALPETSETINIIDRRRLNILKKSCGIVNVGRQSALDYDALFEKLKEIKLFSKEGLDIREITLFFFVEFSISS